MVMHHNNSRLYAKDDGKAEVQIVMVMRRIRSNRIVALLVTAVMILSIFVFAPGISGAVLLETSPVIVNAGVGGIATAQTGSFAGTSIEAAWGEIVTLTATPADGFRFARWTTESPNVTINNATMSSVTFTMPNNPVTATAVFEAVRHNVTVELLRPPGVTAGGTAIARADGSIPASGVNISVHAGAIVTLTSTPPGGTHALSHWEVVTASSPGFSDANIINRFSPSSSFVMPDGDVTIRAVFVAGRRVTVSANVPTMGTASANTGAAEQYATVAVTASPAEGYRFVRWDPVFPSSITFGDANSATTTFVMPDTAVEIRAVFEPIGSETSLVIGSLDYVRGQQEVLGKTLKVPVSITNNPGIAAIQFYVNYSPSVYRVVGWELGADWSGGFIEVVDRNGTITVAGASTILHHGDKEIITIEFEVNYLVLDGDYPITLRIAELQTLDELNRPVDVAVLEQGGGAAITSVWRGDVNNDGRVTAADALAMLLYIAELQTFEDWQKIAGKVTTPYYAPLSVRDVSEVLMIAVGLKPVPAQFTGPEPAFSQPIIFVERNDRLTLVGNTLAHMINGRYADGTAVNLTIPMGNNASAQGLSIAKISGTGTSLRADDITHVRTNLAEIGEIQPELLPFTTIASVTAPTDANGYVTLHAGNPVIHVGGVMARFSPTARLFFNGPDGTGFDIRVKNISVTVPAHLVTAVVEYWTVGQNPAAPVVTALRIDTTAPPPIVGAVNLIFVTGNVDGMDGTSRFWEAIEVGTGMRIPGGIRIEGNPVTVARGFYAFTINGDVYTLRSFDDSNYVSTMGNATAFASSLSSQKGTDGYFHRLGLFIENEWEHLQRVVPIHQDTPMFFAPDLRVSVNLATLSAWLDDFAKLEMWVASCAITGRAYMLVVQDRIP
jgi:hypothetical protein